MDRSPEFAIALLAKARDDQRMLTVLAKASESPAWGLGFHAQQAVEKALKAALSSRSIRYPRTHDLTALVDLAREHSIATPPDAALLSALTPFGVEQRYPTESPTSLPESLAVPKLLPLVERMLAWAQGICEKGPP